MSGGILANSPLRRRTWPASTPPSRSPRRKMQGFKRRGGGKAVAGSPRAPVAWPMRNLTKALREAGGPARPGRSASLESLKSAGSSIDQAAAVGQGLFHKNLGLAGELPRGEQHQPFRQYDRARRQSDQGPLQRDRRRSDRRPPPAGARHRRARPCHGKLRAKNQLAETGQGRQGNRPRSQSDSGARSSSGASAGLDSDAMVAGAQRNASQEIRAVQAPTPAASRNTLEKVDEEFLKVADKAKTSGEFIDLMVQEIRKLPARGGNRPRQGGFFQTATGEKLYGPIVSRRGQHEAIRRGGRRPPASRSMMAFVKAAAGSRNARSTKPRPRPAESFLSALQSLAPPVAELKVPIFMAVVGAIADATAATSKIRRRVEQGDRGFETAGQGA